MPRTAKLRRVRKTKGAVAKTTTTKAVATKASAPKEHRRPRSPSPSAVVGRILQYHRCPITRELIVDPVVGEDGHMYECSALQRWLQTKQSSPVTNRPMGPRMTPAVSVRQTIDELLESGKVDGETMARFFLARAALRASRSTSPGPDLAGAKRDFARALSVGRAPPSEDKGVEFEPNVVEFQASVVDWMKQGVELCSKSSGMSKDIKKWMLNVGDAVRMAITMPLSQRLTEWKTLSVGTRVRVIDDVLELEQLCERPAPGATAKVKWNPEMQPFAGQVCTVKSMGQASHMNYVLSRAGPSFSFPYDALVLMY